MRGEGAELWARQRPGAPTCVRRHDIVSSSARTWYPPPGWIRMPFTARSAMDQRRKLALEVIEQEVSLSEACRRAGVTRKTGRKWVVRARQDGINALRELSRAPKRMPVRTDPSVERALLAQKEAHPKWGPRKLVVLMEAEHIKLPVRTAERILARHGLTCPH